MIFQLFSNVKYVDIITTTPDGGIEYSLHQRAILSVVKSYNDTRLDTSVAILAGHKYKGDYELGEFEHIEGGWISKFWNKAKNQITDELNVMGWSIKFENRIDGANDNLKQDCLTISQINSC